MVPPSSLAVTSAELQEVQRLFLPAYDSNVLECDLISEKKEIISVLVTKNSIKM